MKPAAYALAIIAASLFAGCAAIPQSPIEFRALTYNIRLDTALDSENAWPSRRDAVVGLLRFYEPDIIALQEVRANQLEELKSDLTDLEFFGVGRDDGKNAGEFSPIAYRRKRFSEEGKGVFWLSETPDRPSRGFDAAFPRIATYVHLIDRYSGRKMLVLSTHWDHVGAVARQNSALIIKEFVTVERRNCEDVALLGDLNATNSSNSYRELITGEPLHFIDARNSAKLPPFGPAGTFNAFDVFHDAKLAIDHIFFSEGVSVERYGVITQHHAGSLPSDHYPVMADFVPARCKNRI